MNTLNSQRNYSFGFDYLNSTFIRVNLNGVELTQPRDFTVNQNEIILVNPPNDGGSLLIYRVTPSNRIVSWTDNSILKADNLNLSYSQLMHLAEEQMDNVRDETITRAIDQAWDVKGNRIKRVGTPTDDMDAVPYGYVRHQKDEVEQLTAEVRQHKSAIEQTQQDVLSRQNAVNETAQRTTELANQIVERINHSTTELTNTIAKANETAEKLEKGQIDEETKNELATALLAKQEQLITSKIAEKAQATETLLTSRIAESNRTITDTLTNRMETDLTTHNTSPTAHGLDQYVKNITKNNNGLTITKGNTATALNLFTNNKEDTNTNLAPTLAVVKELLGNVNLDIEEVLKSKGVRYDFSNEQAWYICLGQAFGGLIIQGGTLTSSFETININKEYPFILPIAFPKKCLGTISMPRTQQPNGYTYRSINMDMKKSTLAKLVFHVWFTYEWSHSQWQEVIIAIGF